MGTDRKYGKVTTEHGDIPEDEPVLVLRARDKTTCPLLNGYRELCRKAGSPQRHIDLIEQAYTRFADWQEAHPDQVRTPASEGSRAWMGE
jgi:hypothetical protein